MYNGMTKKRKTGGKMMKSSSKAGHSGKAKRSMKRRR
jgi:hypothetical protein